MRATALVLLLLAACSNDFERQSQVTKLRVLAVQADPAELVVRQGQPLPRTTLRALAVEPNGAAVSTEFALCKDQLTLLPPDVGCPGDAGIPLPDAGPRAATLDLNDPSIQALAAGFDGGTPAAAGTVPVQIGFTATAPAGLAPDGGPPPGPGGTQRLDGLAAVPLRLGGDAAPNGNPGMKALQVDGAELPADGSGTLRAHAKVTLTPVPADDAKEPTSSGPEKLTFSFYATMGELDSLRSADTTATGQPGTITVEYTAPDPGTVIFWVVVRDGRGGVGWLERTAHIQ